MKKESIFATDNLALAPYLFNEGLKYLGLTKGIGKNQKPKIIFIFDDPKNIGKDLEKAFLNSNEKKYRDSMHYFRSQIQKALNNQVVLIDLGEDNG